MLVPVLKEGTVLESYQIEAIKWMVEREKPSTSNLGISGGLLCMKMGLGKCLTAMQHSIVAQNTNNEGFPTLFIASKTVMYEWKKECIEKFYTNINALYLHKDFIGDKVNTITANEIRKYNIVITTYDLCLSTCKKHKFHKLICEYGAEGLHKDKIIAINTRQKPPFNPNINGSANIYKIPWNRVVCDESQRFSNSKTYTFKSILAIYGDYKWCLTGSPVRNTDADIWSQLRYCGYNHIKEAGKWQHWLFKAQGLNKYIFELNYEKTNIVMPEKIIHKHLVEMDDEQKNTYTALLVETQNLYTQMLSNFISYAEILAMFTRLRQVCIAPSIILSNTKSLVQKSVNNAIEKTKVHDWIYDDEGSAGIDSPKMKKIIDIIEKVPFGEKIIVFSSFVSCLKMVEKAITINLERNHVLLTGLTGGKKRNDILTSFKENPTVTILLVHYKIGSEGLNITEANNVIFIEPWWCPVVHNQGISRCWRRGQTKNVNIHFIITNKTIETAILTMCENKEKISNYYLYNEEYTAQKLTSLNKDDLRKLLEM